MSQTLLEKLQYKDERNLLIQGLPSSIEKQFVKLAFAKNLSPLLKIRKIDFALVFVVNEQQLGNIVRELLPALQRDAKFWVAYPKIGSKIATTLNRDCSWGCITGAGFEWSARLRSTMFGPPSGSSGPMRSASWPRPPCGKLRSNLPA